MLYDLLALLWDSPSDLPALVDGMAERTGRSPSAALIDGHLWLLFQFGFVDAAEGGAAPVYALTPRGSEFLAFTAETREYARA